MSMLTAQKLQQQENHQDATISSNSIENNIIDVKQFNDLYDFCVITNSISIYNKEQ